ncbi:hypothetical protein [Scandinavium goeteborgense]|uniref:hypothetical protein n=1 Tax=Scandinavium goeteborgense TaxID=1851514 RepID=UPI001445FD6A|nr:hypothetical protein [Scandinavium goeteborgense]QKN80069.1 hypothetical protein A8O29_001730 [Scandinavium goeteborgense]
MLILAHQARTALNVPCGFGCLNGDGLRMAGMMMNIAMIRMTMMNMAMMSMTNACGLRSAVKGKQKTHQ